MYLLDFWEKNLTFEKYFLDFWNEKIGLLEKKYQNFQNKNSFQTLGKKNWTFGKKIGLMERKLVFCEFFFEHLENIFFGLLEKMYFLDFWKNIFFGLLEKYTFWTFGKIYFLDFWENIFFGLLGKYTFWTLGKKIFRLLKKKIGLLERKLVF